MPISLRDSLEPLTLRESARYAPGQANFADQLEADDTNPISRGWTSTSFGLQGSDLLAEANAAERAGDLLRAQQLELQAQDHMQRAQTLAPTTQNFTDIDGLGAAANWLGGQVGSGARSMIAPLAGGVGGRVVGGLLGALTPIPGGAAIGATIGGGLGAFVPSYDMQYNESVGQSMMDPEIRAKRTADEIHRTGQKVGAVGGALEAVVPASVAKIGLGGIGKRTIGGVMAREAGEEALTEGAQSYVGQTGQNQLAGRELTDYDHLDAFNAAMAGTVGGGVMSGAGAAVGAARDKLAAGGEKVAKAASDPVQTVVDAVHRAVKGDPIKRADREIAEFESGQRSLSKMFEDERATANDERIFDAPKADEPDAQVSARMREDIDRWAKRILTAKPHELGPRESELREAAAQYESDKDWMKLRGVLRKNKLADERSSMMSAFEPEGMKASEMTPEGQELDALSNAWLKNEGKRYGEYFADGSDEAKGLGAKLFAWIKNDFGAKMTDEGEIFIPRAFIEALGDRAPGVVESAITAARKEGWDIKNAGDAVATIRQYVNSNEGDTSFLTSAIRYSQQENWTPKMIQRFAKELRQKGGRLDKDDYRWLKTQVGDIVGVLEHFQKPSRFYKAENKLKSPSTKDELQSDLGLEAAKGGDTDSGSDITENDGDWNSGVNTFSAPKSTINVLGTYDIADPDQLTEMKARDGEEMGIVDHARRTLSGPSLSRRLRELTNEYDAPLAEINRRVRMKVDIKDEAQATGIGPGHVEKLRVSPDAFNSKTKKRDPIDGKDRGVLFVEVRDGDPFVTSSAKLINTVRQDKDTESSQYGAAEAEDRMLQGLAQLMAAMPEAGMIPTGRVGYKNEAGGSITWLREAGSKMRSGAGGRQAALIFGPSPKTQGAMHPLNLPDDFNFIEKSKAEGYSRANARAQRQARFKQSVDAETDLNMRDLKDMTVSELETLWSGIAGKGMRLLTAKQIATEKLEKNAANLTKAFNQAKKRGDVKRIGELNKQLTAAEAELQKAKEPLQRAMDTLRDQLNTIRDEIESRTQITSGIKYVTDDFGMQRLVKRGKERVPGDRKLTANISEKNTGDTLTQETNDETKNLEGGIYGSRGLAEAAAKPGERVRKFARGRWLIERKTGGIKTTSRVVSSTETEEFAQNAKEKEIRRDLETGYEITTEPTDVEGWWKGENGPWKDLPLPTTNLNAPDIVKARVHALLKKGVPAANFAIGNMRPDALKRMADMLRTKFWHDMPQYEGDSMIAVDRLDDFKEKKSVREKVAAKRSEANKRLVARKKIDERAEMMLDKIQSRLKEIGDESGKVLGGNKRPRHTEGGGVQAPDSRVSSADGQRAEADTQVAGKRGGSDAKAGGGRGGAATVPDNGVTAKQVRADGEKGSFENPHFVPMNYKVHRIDSLRPELRSKYRAGVGISALIANGDRTATTRTPQDGVKVGDFIKFPGVDGVYRVTGFDKINLDTAAGREAWSKKEGWDVSMIDAFGKQVSTGKVQMSFERAKQPDADQAKAAGEKGSFENPIVGDIWDQDGFVVVSTNLGGVHGRGLAKQASDKGLITKQNRDFASSPKNQKIFLVAVKGHEPSTAKVPGRPFSEQVVGKNVELLKAELAKVVGFAKANPNEKIYLPYVGLGFGEGNVAEIGPILAEVASQPNIFMVAKDEGTVRKYAESFTPGVRRDATTRLKQPDAAQSKQDAWVMKFASMSMKDMRAFIKALPAEKLEKAFDVLDSFFPADNSNPFWQRNNLDNYTDAKSDVVFEAQELIRDRLGEDGATEKEANTSAEQLGDLDAKVEKLDDEYSELIEPVLVHEKVDSYWESSASSWNDDWDGNAKAYLEWLGGRDKKLQTLMSKVIDKLKEVQAASRARSDFVKKNNDALASHPEAMERFLDALSTLPKNQEGKLFSINLELMKSMVKHRDDAKWVQNEINGRERRLEKYKEEAKTAINKGKLNRIIETIEHELSVLKNNSLQEMVNEAAKVWSDEYRRYYPTPVLTKNSEQTTEFKPIDPEQALADIARMLGKDFDAKVVKKLGGKAGTWKPGIIRMATSAADGTQFHEALHELFNQMRTHGAANVAQIIERVANSPLILRKLEQLLSDHPKAIKQLKSPEEAAAYLFQFWNMGLINVGPETKSLFQTIKELIVDAAKELHSWVNAAKRDERKAEKAQKMDEAEVRRLFEALAGGAAATSDANVRQALYDGLRKNIEAHTKAVEDLGQRVEGFWQGIGRYVVTSESMLNLYSKHPELKTVADKFHQMAGKSMKNQARNSSLMARGGLIEAKHAEVQRRLNPFERFLMDGKYDEKDMALAAKHLEANTKSADKKINDLIDFVHRYYGEMYDYMVQSDVRRLDPHSEERWVPIQKRKDYFTQSWSIEELTKDHDGFVSTLLDKHAKELAHMAQQANAEIAAWNKDPKMELASPTAQAQLDKQIAERLSPEKPIAKLGPLQEVTPEMIAEQIYVRLLNSTGMVDIQETNWSLGLTPAAGAVNRRELDWLDKEAFSKYKSKDLVEIVTNYTRTMVARAEYQKRFGYGGEVIGDAMDTAMLREMGGQALVDSANASLDGEIKRWKKEARAWYKDNPGIPYPEPYPTLRLVGIQQHRAQVGADASNEALIKAEKTLRPAVNAVRAMEGTLGNDISPAMRSFNSWINTYQNVRLLPLALFTNFSDVIGITTNGGTLGDAWNAFTAGMREVRNTWVNEKGSDSATLRAEEWGVSDAGAMLDTLGQNYSSVYMTEKARNINNKFFRIIGMEGWNRGVRITATAVGERIIGDWVKNGVDAKKPGEKARFERLFGEGADPKKIKLDAQGNLDTQDAANRAAIQRFVQDSVMSSNSAVRAIWMSDPRMATFAHLKNFAYAFHSVMLKGILAQAAEGNLRPALVAGLGFASISIAAAAVKEMLIPGDEPYWMKGGLDGYLEYGYNMANLGGVPQMYLESVTDFDPAKLAGPFWDQIQNTLSSPIPGFGINLSPVDGETEILRDRKVMVELAKALPAGNLAGRAMDSLVGD